jgi:hypothetical protein
MEIPGLVIGGVALVGLFSTCLQCFDLIDTAADQSRSFEFTRVKFEDLHVRLRLWGTALNLNGEPDDILRGADVSVLIERRLPCIRMLFEDVTVMTSKYVLKQSHSTEVVQGRFSSFKDRYLRSQRSLEKEQDETSTVSKARWAIRDKGKSELLISDLKDFVENLAAITPSVVVLSRRKALAEQEVASFSDPERLQLIEDATSIVAPELSDAASSRRLMLRYAETIASSANETFVTAESYRVDESLASDPPPDDRWQSRSWALYPDPEPNLGRPTTPDTVPKITQSLITLRVKHELRLLHKQEKRRTVAGMLDWSTMILNGIRWYIEG